MSRTSYAAELKDLNDSARMLRQAAKQNVSIVMMLQLHQRCLEAELAAARAMGLLTSKGRAA